MIAEWGSDTRISLPVASNDARLITMHGFAFTESGLVHDMSKTDLEAYANPSYAPISPADYEYDDEEVE